MLTRSGSKLIKIVTVILQTTSNNVLTTDASWLSSSARDFDNDVDNSFATSKNISGLLSSASIEPLTSIIAPDDYNYTIHLRVARSINTVQIFTTYNTYNTPFNIVNSIICVIAIGKVNISRNHLLLSSSVLKFLTFTNKLQKSAARDLKVNSGMHIGPTGGLSARW